MDVITLALAKNYTNKIVSETGLKGKSAYEYAVEGGFAGTEEEFIQALASETYYDIENGEGENSLQQTPETETWTTTNDKVKEYIDNNIGTADDPDQKIRSNGYVVQVGAYGKSSIMTGAKSQNVGKKSHTEGSKNIAFESNAHAEGNETFAAGKHSHAEGLLTSATGNNSHSEGAKTLASGAYSHAEGHNTTASGNISHAEGDSTQATRENCHAEGASTKATGSASHAEGYETIAEGDYSHAEGFHTTASGDIGHAEGYFTTASGNNSHAEGADTTASGNHSHAEGYETIAEGDYSHTEGVFCRTIGSHSHAEGFDTVASGITQHVQGKHNIEDIPSDEHINGRYAHIVGNGNSENRSNAHTVDWNGNAWYQGDVYVGGTSQDDGKKLATEEYVTSVKDYVTLRDISTERIYAIRINNGTLELF